MNIRSHISNIKAVPALRSWINTHGIDPTDNLQRIFNNAAVLMGFLPNITFPSNETDFNQKLFFTVLDILENKYSGDLSLEVPPVSILPASHAIPLKNLKRSVLVDDIRAALELHAKKGNSRIDQAQVTNLSSLINSSREKKIVLNENHLALLIELVFSPVVERRFIQVDNLQEDDYKENEAPEFEHEPADEKAQAVISANRVVPSEAVDLSIKLFGALRAAALINLFTSWDKTQIYKIPAVTNAILAIPLKFTNILSDYIIALGAQNFERYNLEKELDTLYKIVLTNNEKYINKFIYALTWPMKNRIYSVSNTMKIIDCEDFIGYFPELEIQQREFLTQEKQIIFDLIIHHMQAYERLYHIQNQYICGVLDEPKIVSPGLGRDVNSLICEYVPLETQGFFAKKLLRQVPKDEQLEIQHILAP
jgi:hypothetical protein